MAILPKSVTKRESLQLEVIEENRDKSIPQIWKWGEYSPFYRGERWQDYKSGNIRSLDGNLLYVRMDGTPRLYAFQNTPKNAYIVTNGLATVLSNIPMSQNMVSPDLPTVLYVDKNASYEIVVPNYNNGTITRYNLKIKSLNNALGDDNPITQKIAQGAVQILDAIFKSLIKSNIGANLDVVPSLDDIGSWYIASQETAPLKPVNKKGALDGIDMTLDDKSQGKSKFNFAPFLIGALVLGSLL
jgi:hypothetical protein